MKLLCILMIAVCAACVNVSDLSEEHAKIVDLSRSDYTFAEFPVPRTAKDERCLTEAIYYEAGNQPVLGKEVVALVIMNRVMSQRYPKTICGVVSQAHLVKVSEEEGLLKRICQFSFWCETKYKPNKAVWEQSQKVAHHVLMNYWHREVLDQFRHAVYFHATYVNPQWRKTKVFLGQIDRHLFYGERSTCDTMINS